MMRGDLIPTPAMLQGGIVGYPCYLVSLSCRVHNYRSTIIGRISSRDQGIVDVDMFSDKIIVHCVV